MYWKKKKIVKGMEQKIRSATRKDNQTWLGKRLLGKLSKKGGNYKHSVHIENEKIKNVIEYNEVLPKIMSKDTVRSTLSHSKFTLITNYSI